MSEPTDAERLIREARETARRAGLPIAGAHFAREAAGYIRRLADALEAAIKERDKALADVAILSHEVDDGAFHYERLLSNEKTANAKLTEENRVLRANADKLRMAIEALETIKNMLLHPDGPFVMINAANFADQNSRNLSATTGDK